MSDALLSYKYPTVHLTALCVHFLFTENWGENIKLILNTLMNVIDLGIIEVNRKEQAKLSSPPPSRMQVHYLTFYPGAAK